MAEDVTVTVSRFFSLRCKLLIKSQEKRSHSTAFEDEVGESESDGRPRKRIDAGIASIADVPMAEDVTVTVSRFFSLRCKLLRKS